jgi:hypothetical protein
MLILTVFKPKVSQVSMDLNRADFKTHYGREGLNHNQCEYTLTFLCEEARN